MIVWLGIWQCFRFKTDKPIFQAREDFVVIQLVGAGYVSESGSGYRRCTLSICKVSYGCHHMVHSSICWITKRNVTDGDVASLNMFNLKVARVIELSSDLEHFVASCHVGWFDGKSFDRRMRWTIVIGGNIRIQQVQSCLKQLQSSLTESGLLWQSKHALDEAPIKRLAKRSKEKSKVNTSRLYSESKRQRGPKETIAKVVAEPADFPRVWRCSLVESKKSARYETSLRPHLGVVIENAVHRS